MSDSYIKLEEARLLTAAGNKQLQHRAVFLRAMKDRLEDGTIRAFALFRSGELRAIPAVAWFELKLLHSSNDWYATHVDAPPQQFDLRASLTGPKIEPVYLPKIWPGRIVFAGALKLRFLKSDFLKKPRMSDERGAIEKCCNDLLPERLQEFKAMNPAMRNLEFRELLPPKYRSMDRKTLLKWLDLFLK